MGKIKMLPNRISKIVMLETALLKVGEALAILDAVVGEDTQISDEDYKSLRKIADTLKRQSDDVFDVIKLNPEFLEAPLTIAEMDKDKLFYELCDKIRAAILAFMIKLEREQNIAGAEYYNACCVFESDIDDKIKRGNNAKAQNVQAQLDAIDRKRGGGNSGEKKDPPTGK
jgi:argonaute-like protein implicated in RNA metabolism and viral defense